MTTFWDIIPQKCVDILERPRNRGRQEGFMHWRWGPQNLSAFEGGGHELFLPSPNISIAPPWGLLTTP